MRLSEFEWNNGQGLENLQIWGVEPIRALANAIQLECGGGADLKMGEDYLRHISHLIEDRINEMDFAISGFMDEMKKQE